MFLLRILSSSWSPHRQQQLIIYFFLDLSKKKRKNFYKFLLPSFEKLLENVHKFIYYILKEKRKQREKSIIFCKAEYKDCTTTNYYIASLLTFASFYLHHHYISRMLSPSQRILTHEEHDERNSNSVRKNIIINKVFYHPKTKEYYKNGQKIVFKQRKTYDLMIMMSRRTCACGYLYDDLARRLKPSLPRFKKASQSLLLSCRSSLKNFQRQS